MNPRLALYVSGASMLTRTIYLPGGRRIAVLDPQRRGRAAFAALAGRGLHPIMVARLTRRPVAFVAACAGTSKILSNSRLARV
jgi:hypothetical protein